MSEKYRDYEHDSGRKSRVRIEKGKELGKGSNSSVHEVKARVRVGEDKKVLGTLVMKKYKRAPEDMTPAELARNSLQNYELLKRLGFPVPSTYRLDQETNRILMTNVNLLHPDSISLTSSDTEMPEDFSLRTVSNFEQVVHEAIHCAELATANNIEIAGDAYTLTVPRTGEGPAQLFLTDLETVRVVPDSRTDLLANVKTNNIEQAQEFFYEYVIERYIQEEFKAPYCRTLGRLFGEYKARHGMRETEIDEILKIYLSP